MGRLSNDYSPPGGSGGSSVASQTGNAGKFLTTDGTTTSWALVASGLTPTAVKTSAYTAAASDLVPVDTTSGAVTVTLPAAPADKTQVGIKHVTRGGTNTVTIACGGSDVINKTGGATTATLTLLNQGAVLQYKASSAVWYVVSDDLPLSQLDTRYPVLSATPSAGQVPVYNSATGKFDPGTPKAQTWWSTYNITASSMGFFRNGVARGRAGGNGCRIYCIGDSTTKGDQISPPLPTSYPTQLKTQLGARGAFGSVIDGYVNWWVHGQASSETRVTKGTGWSINNGWNAQSTATGTLTYTPTTPCNKFTIWYLSQGTGGQTFSINIDGGTNQTVSMNGSSVVLSTTITAGSVGTHTLTVNPPATAGQQCFIVGFLAEDTTTNAMNVSQLGLSGSTTANWVSNTYVDPFPQVIAGAPDLVPLMLGVNDLNNDATPATIQTNLTTICTRIRAANADPLLILPFYDLATNKPAYASTWAAVSAAYYAVADALDVGLVDLSLRWRYPSLAVKSAPYSFTDGLHHTAKGYADLAAMMAVAISTVAA